MYQISIEENETQLGFRSPSVCSKWENNTDSGFETLFRYGNGGKAENLFGDGSLVNFAFPPITLTGLY